MHTNDDRGFRLLSQRDTPSSDVALIEGVPDHLRRPLIEWLTAYLAGTPNLVQRIALRLRVPLDAPEVEQLLDAVVVADQHQLLDIADMAIHFDLGLRWDIDVGGMEHNPNEASLADWIPEWRWPKGSRPAAVQDLAEVLADAGSAYRIDWTERCLRRRVDPTIEAAVKEALARPAERHLRDAWAATYGRHPDPSKAYDEAVRSVEAASIPVVLPNGERETLGKVLGHLRDAIDKWELAIGGRNNGDAGPVVSMIELLWRGHVGRHAGGPSSRPQTREEAEMAFYLAVTLVQWFTTGAVRRRNS